VNVRDDTSSGNGGLDEGVELFVTADGELQVAGRDALDLEVLGRVAGKLEDLGREVLHDRGRVDRGRGADALALGGAALQVAVDTADRELKSGSLGLGGSTGGRSLSLSSSFSGHVKIIYKIILGSVYKEDGCAKFGSEIRQG